MEANKYSNRRTEGFVELMRRLPALKLVRGVDREREIYYKVSDEEDTSLGQLEYGGGGKWEFVAYSREQFVAIKNLVGDEYYVWAQFH